jgi:hypothetical protein
MKKLAALAFLLSTAAGAGQADFPAGYREWVFLTSGVDMNYDAMSSMNHHMFDNVFVENWAYQAFLQTGTWPDKTRLVKEGREGLTKGSINKSGQFQSGPTHYIEMHVKDSQTPGGWGFFEFGGETTPADQIPQDAQCYSCHQKHGAVDTTFVQFYPTLLPIAKAKGTLSKGYTP